MILNECKTKRNFTEISAKPIVDSVAGWKNAFSHSKKINCVKSTVLVLMCV